MPFGADSDMRTRTYRIYTRQTKLTPFKLSLQTVSANAENIDARLEYHLNIPRLALGGWVRWFLLVAEHGEGAFPFRVTEDDNGKWKATRC